MKSLFSDSLGYGGEPPIVSVFHCFYNLMVKDTSMIKGMSEKYRDSCMNANHGVLDLFKTLHFTFKFTKVAIFCLYFQRSGLNSKVSDHEHIKVSNSSRFLLKLFFLII